MVLYVELDRVKLLHVQPLFYSVSKRDLRVLRRILIWRCLRLDRRPIIRQRPLDGDANNTNCPLEQAWQDRISDRAAQPPEEWRSNDSGRWRCLRHGISEKTVVRSKFLGIAVFLFTLAMGLSGCSHKIDLPLEFPTPPPDEPPAPIGKLEIRRDAELERQLAEIANDTRG